MLRSQSPWNDNRTKQVRNYLKPRTPCSTRIPSTSLCPARTTTFPGYNPQPQNMVWWFHHINDAARETNWSQFWINWPTVNINRTESLLRIWNRHPDVYFIIITGRRLIVSSLNRVQQQQFCSINYGYNARNQATQNTLMKARNKHQTG